MTTTEMPYFMENEDWYYHDEKEWKFKLTDKVPPKAVESYNEFYKEIDKIYEDNEDI